MANLSKKNDVFRARFRFDGKEFKRSLRTTDPNHARAALRRIENVLHWLAIQHIVVPDNVDPGDFIISGGVFNERREERHLEPPTLEIAMEEYLNNLGHVAESHRYTIGVHLGDASTNRNARGTTTASGVVRHGQSVGQGPVNVLVSRGLEQVKPLLFCPALAGDLRTGSRSDSGPPSSPESASSTVSTLRGSPGTLASTPTRRWDTVCGCG